MREPASEAEFDPAPHTRKRKWPRRLVITLAGLFLALVSLIAGVLYVPALSTLVVRRALARFDASVPASFEWETLEGSFARGLYLRELSIYDSESKLLLHLDELEIELSPIALFGREARVETVALRGLDVYVDRRWEDLASASPEPEKPKAKREGVGPKLPLAVFATLELEDLRVLEGKEALTQLDELRLELHAQGHDAQLGVSLAGLALALAPTQLEVADAALALEWSAPELRIDSLDIDSSLAQLHLPEPARFDLAREAGAVSLALSTELEALDAVLDLRTRLPDAQLPKRLDLSLHARAQGRAAIVELGLGLGDAGELALEGSITQTVETGALEALARLDAEFAAGLVDPKQPQLRVEARAHAQREIEAGPIEARLALRVHEGATGQSVVVDTRASQASLEPLGGQLTIALHGLGIDLTADLDHNSTHSPNPSGAFALSIPELGRPLALVAALLDQPALATNEGSLSFTGHCESMPGGADSEAPVLRCPTQLTLAGFEGFGTQLGKAELDGTIEPLGPELGFDLTLSAHELVVADGAYAFTQLDTHLAGTPSTLSLEAEGQGPHDEVALALTLDTLAEGRRVVFETLRASTSRTAVLAGIELREPGGLTVLDDRLELDDLALRAFGASIAASGTVALDPSGVHDLRLSVRGLNLARVDAAFPGPSMRGRVDLEARVRGPLDQLRGFVELEGESIRIAQLELGDLGLSLRRDAGPGSVQNPGLVRTIQPAFVALGEPSRSSPRAGDLMTEFAMYGPLSRRVELRARVPVRGFALGPGPIELRLAVEQFELEQLAALMPETPAWWDPTGPSAAPEGQPLLVPEGRIDLDLAVGGSLRKPTLALALRGSTLELDRADLGSLALFVELDRHALDLSLNLEPGFLEGLELRAHVPLALDLAHGRARWDRSNEHLVSVDLSGFDLAQIEAALAPSLPALTGLSALPVSGEFSAGLRMQGTPADPSVDLRLHGRALALGQTPLGRLRVDLGYANQTGLAQVELITPFAERLDAWMQIPLVVDPLAESPVALDLEGPIEGAVHAEAVALAKLGALLGQPLAGLARLELTLGGSLMRPQTRSELELAKLGIGRGELGDLSATLELDTTRAELELDFIHAGRHTLALSAAVPVIVDLFAERGPSFAWDHEGSHRLRLAADGIDETLLAALTELPSDLEIDASFGLRGGGQLADFALDATVEGDLSKGQDDDERKPVVFAANLHADQAQQRLTLNLSPSQSRALDLDVELDLPLPAFVAGQHAIGQTPYRVAFDAPHFELTELAGFMPESLHDPQGVLEAAFHGEGLLATPDLEGRVVLRDSAITVVPLRQRLADIALELELSHKHAELLALHLAAGRGTLEGSGRVDVLAGLGLDAKLELDIDDFPLVQPGMPPIAFASGVDIDLRSRPEALDVEIALRKPELSVGGKAESAPKAIPTSDSIVFVHEGEAAWEPDLDELAADDSGHLGLHLKLLDPLRIVGSPIDVAWTGAVSLEREDGRLAVTGQLDTRRGRIDLAGSQFDIQRGSVSLPDDGALDPYIELLASTTVADIEITATIRGRVSRPELSFASNPPHSEYEIFSLLVTGSTTPGEAARSNLEVQAASLLASVSSPVLQRKIEETLHIDRAKLEFGDTIDQPILTVGKRVSPKVYLETRYHHNSPNDENTAEVRVQYEFGRRWSLETHFGDAAVGGVGTFWSRTIGTPTWKVSPRERAEERSRERDSQHHDP